MRRKWLALALSLTMVVGCMTGCGNDKSTNTGSSDAGKTDSTKQVEMVPEDTGKVLNIWVWNTEFKERFEKYYPDYDKETQSIGDVKVKWTTNPNEKNVYQTKLDEALEKQESASADDKIDLFLMEMDYVAKYTNTDYTLDVHSLGLTDEDMANMYDYTKEACTDASGSLKAVSWQGCPGGFIYRRSYAKDIFGTDDPEKIQEQVSDWDKFKAAAQTVNEKSDGKIAMVSGFDDTFRVFANNATSKWVDDNKTIQVDEQIEKWIELTKEFTDKGYNQKTSLWADEWGAGMGKDGNVFGYFFPSWGISFSMVDYSGAKKDDDGNITPGGSYGDWAMVTGPQSFNWGGSFLTAAAGTDNGRLVGDIMKKLTCDTAIMKQISKDTQDFVNNQASNKELIDEGATSDFLGGQSLTEGLDAAAKNISCANVTGYDQGCIENMQTAMKEYFLGKVSKEDAMAKFYELVTTTYPALSKPE